MKIKHILISAAAAILSAAVLTSCATAPKHPRPGKVMHAFIRSGSAAIEIYVEPGSKYQLQKTGSLDSAKWQDIGGPVMADSATLMLVDSNATGQSAFYRIIPVK